MALPERCSAGACSLGFACAGVGLGVGSFLGVCIGGGSLESLSGVGFARGVGS